MSRNPYIVCGQEPTLRNSVFIFMDILGYTDLVQTAKTADSQQKVLRDLHLALSDSRHFLEERDLPPELRLGDKDQYALKAFTDNIVIGWPIYDDAESEFGLAFMHLSTFQFNMARRGYFVRGGLSIGPAYIDEIAVFGDALVQAYFAENKVARDPRIVLADSTIRSVKKHLTYYAQPSHAPHSRELLIDADGQWFINYLDAVLIAEEEHGPFYIEFLQHKDCVEQKLKEYASNPPVWSKYAWVARYHNFFCDMHPRHFSDEHRIDVDLYTASPSRIFEN